MTVVYDWLSDELVHATYSGIVTGEDLIASVLHVGNSIKMEKIRYIISDWSKIGESRIKPDDIRQLAAYIYALAKSFPGVKNASVVAEYESGQARAYFYEVLTKDTSWQLKTFTSFEQALQWCYADKVEQDKTQGLLDKT
ncbi:hypothetical protein [Aliikangiella maris]|uniref:STAS/SEC14 domain-containing protein n=2 Tax=Aliikangiella maris TaxID=3162458 RepID=A0ABV3MMG4_9GAMM